MVPEEDSILTRNKLNILAKIWQSPERVPIDGPRHTRPVALS